MPGWMTSTAKIAKTRRMHADYAAWLLAEHVGSADATDSGQETIGRSQGDLYRMELCSQHATRPETTRNHNQGRALLVSCPHRQRLVRVLISDPALHIGPGPSSSGDPHSKHKAV